MIYALLVLIMIIITLSGLLLFDNGKLSRTKGMNLKKVGLHIAIIIKESREAEIPLQVKSLVEP